MPTISNGKLDNTTLFRTQSTTSLNERDDDSNNNQNKLPSLLLPPSRISASMDNCKSSHNFSDRLSYDIVYVKVCEEMPPRSDGEKTSSNTKNVVDKKKKDTSIDAPKYSKSNGGDDKIKKTRLLRNNDLLAQSSTETLLDMLKANSGIKECTDETVSHIHGVGRVCVLWLFGGTNGNVENFLIRRFSQNYIYV